MINVGDLLAVLRLRDEMTPALNTAIQNVEKAASSVRSTGASLTQAGTALSIGITAPLVAAAGASLHFSSEFETSMTRLVSLAGVSKGELAGVKQHILDLAPAVGIGPNALAAAMTKIASTVSDTKVGMEILDIAARGSAAGMGEAVDVAGALTAVINSYGKENITAARAGDILTQTVKDGGAEAKELAPILANVVPMAAQLGITFEEVGANIATVTKLGVPATEAVTQLAAVMTASLKPTREGSEALASIGMSYESLRKAMKEQGLMATLVDLTKRFGDNKEALTQVFGRIEALRNVMGSAGQQAETYAEVLDNIKNSAGKLDEAFKAMEDTQSFGWAQLTASLQTIAITMGDALAPAFRDALNAAKPFLQWVMDMAKAFQSLDPATQKVIIGVAAVAAAIGPLLVVLGTLASSAGSIIAIAPAVGAAFAAMTGPIGLTLIAVSALAGAVLLFKQRIDDIQNAKNNIGQPIKGLKDDMGNVVYTIDNAAEALAKLPPKIIDVDKAFQVALGITPEVAAANRKKIELTEEQQKALDKYQKALAEVNDKIKDAQSYDKQLTASQIMAIGVYKEMGLSVSDIAIKLGVSERAIKAYEDATKEYNDEGRKMAEETEKLRDKLRGIEQEGIPAMYTMQDLASALKDVSKEVDALPPQEAIPFYEWTGPIKETEKAIKDTGITVKNVFSGAADILDNLSGKFTQLAAVAMRTGKAIVDNLAEGNVVGAVVAGVTGAITFIGKLFGGVSEEVRKARKEVNDFEKDLQKSLNSVQRKEAGGESWKMSLIAMRDAYLLVGRSAAEAEDALRRLWAAAEQGPAAVEAMKAEIQRTFDEVKLLNSAVEEFGLTIDQLGPRLAGQKLQEQADVLESKWRLLERAGIDVNVISEAMAEKIRAFVAECVKAGIEVPANMQEIVRQLTNVGLLTDINSGKEYDAVVKSAKRLDELMAHRQSLADSIAGEAPEEVIGVVEARVKGQMEVLDKEIKSQADTLRSEAEQAGIDLKNVFKSLNIDPVHVQVIWDIPPLPSGSAAPPQAHPQAEGGDYLLTKPTLFLAGEAGPERATFTPLNKASAASAFSPNPNQTADMRNELRMIREELEQRDRQLPYLLSVHVRDALAQGR